MRKYFTRYCIVFFSVCISSLCNAQLSVNSNLTPEELAQKLTGNGVQVFNVHFTGNSLMTGAFYNDGNTTNINIDSGIVLTTGRAAGGRGFDGVNGNGSTGASDILADNQWLLPGDADIAAELNVDPSWLYDACVLEFDFIPIGDSVSFKYVFSSEEYRSDFVCTFNDAFAFFISGPGITGSKNIALVPGTNTPVSILNVNNVTGVTCNNNTRYYVNNTTNAFFTHDGHTTVLTAAHPVINCQTYHLKLVITDAADDNYDSGVFLEAKSLTSKNIRLTGNFSSKRLRIGKPFTSADPTPVILQYSGTAVNGTDVDLLATGVVIPAGQTETFIDINPIIDNLDEGIETLKITALYSCTLNDPAPNDSIEIQVRDYAPLSITPDSVITCRKQSVQLTAATGYANYRWDNNSTLSSTSVRNPVATPTAAATTYYCTAANGTCKARDSVVLFQKKIYLETVKKVSCSSNTDGAITITGGSEWQRPLSFSFNNGPYGNDSTLDNLAKGFYILKLKDATGCVDSVNYFLDQQNADPQIASIVTTPASCSGLPDGTATITVTGGLMPYYFSTDSTNFNTTDSFNLFRGNYKVYVKDSSGCTARTRNFTIPFSNILRIQTIEDSSICEGNTVILLTDADADSYSWRPSISLSNDTIQNPIATPSSTTKYVVTGKKGICQGKDSVTIFVNKAPVANAGNDAAICYNTNITLHGSGGNYLQWQPAGLLNNDSIPNPVTDSLLADTYFTLQVTDSKGCVSLHTDSVKITVRAEAKVSLGGDTIIAVNQPLQLFARDVNNSGFTNFNWSPADGLSDPFEQDPVAKISIDSIEYTVNTSTPEGCPSSDSIKVKTYRGPQIYVPTAFSPNGDGYNDILHIVAAGVKKLSYFNIYNRWGQLVYSINNAHVAWDGKFKGKQVAAGTYVWVAEGIAYKGNAIQRRGTIVLIY
jgi:gliding motility-associated-like protein